jgi:hypothetical protein
VKPEPPERRRGNGNDHFGETVLVLTGTTAWSALTNTEQMVAGRVPGWRGRWGFKLAQRCLVVRASHAGSLVQIRQVWRDPRSGSGDTSS